MDLITVNIYLFVAAALLAVIPIIIIFQKSMQRLKEHPKDYPQVQRRFFIGSAISKILPVIIIIFGILRMPSGIEISRLYIPWLIIGVAVVYGFFYISSKKKLQANQEVKRAVNTLIMITRPHLFTVPIMVMIFLFLMTL